ncbi:MAG: helix-turn-helix domain-containing protein, partial [Clostridia bacterium]|nr:helix-turn-helix domain-containing protein [Clostridia bacterium]
TKEKTVSGDFNQLSDGNLSIIKIENYLYYRIKPIRNKTYYVFIEDKKENSDIILKLIAVLTSNYIKTYYEKHDKTYFLKSIIQKQATPADIMQKTSQYKIQADKQRVVLLLKLAEKPDFSVAEILSNLFIDQKQNYVVELDNCDIIYIVEVEDNFENQLSMIASTIITTVEEELLIPVVIGVGKAVNNLLLLEESYHSANLACEIGGVFESEKNIFTYSKLGIGVFINKLSKADLEQFFHQIVDTEAFEKLDDEIVKTIQKFFENNLNISETARKMYLHRNTLVYRIEKVQKQTGLDVRNFDDALLFKTAYMVKTYLEKLNDNT